MRAHLFLGALAIMLSACGASIEAGMDTANDLLYQKQYVASERLYRKLLRRLEDRGSRLSDDEESERLSVLDRLGKLNALYLHDYDAAIRFYRQLVKYYPKTDQALAALATVADLYQYKLGNVPAAIELYQELSREFPDAPESQRDHSSDRPF
ncbi:MAG: tetratricopeptide repeat protein [Clostridia bacterium]|nr:tetratricopeptide repeat protein [Deltaproteobacteria bacterium]